MHNIELIVYVHQSAHMVFKVDSVQRCNIIYYIECQNSDMYNDKYTLDKYRITGNFGEVFNLAIWQTYASLWKNSDCQI